MTDEPKICDKCQRKLVTVSMLARAVHAGCALTGKRHDLDDCPLGLTFLLDAKALWKHMDKQSESAD